MTMGHLFISHSSRDSQLIDKLVDLLEIGVGVHGKDAIFASSVAGKDIPFGEVNDYVRGKLRNASLAIFILSPDFFQSPYCMAEMGAAWATDRPTFVLTAPPLDRGDVTAVFSGLQSERLADEQSLDKLAEAIEESDVPTTPPRKARWTKKRDDFIDWTSAHQPAARSAHRQRVEDSPEWRDRGHWSEAIVDGTIYIGTGYLGIDVKASITATIRQGRVLPTVYAYLTNNGYHNWVRLTEDKTYEYYKDAIELFTRQNTTIIDDIRSATGNCDDIDMISLGPGDGWKDVSLLNAFAQRVDIEDVYYYPFDVNSSMISHAMKTAGMQPSLKKRLRVKAILADFHSLPEFSQIYQFRKAPNVLSLAGNTLGNLSDDRAFLTTIHDRAMYEGDVLLLEVRNNQKGDTVPRTPAHKRFDFGPLELLGVEFVPEKVRYTPMEGYSVVPDTRTVVASYEDMEYGGEKFENVELSVIHEYDPAKLKETCEMIGFNFISQREHNTAAMLILQK